MNAAVERPRRWRLSAATVRAVLSGHGLLGLSFAGLIYLVCLTGTIVVFAHDIERWEKPGSPKLEAIAPAALDRALAAVQRQAPADATLYVGLPSPDEAGATITAFGPEFDRDWAVAADGAIEERDTPIAAFLVDLHTALHLPRAWGGFLVGMAGVALLSSLISGVLAHPRLFRDAFHLRLGGSRRLQAADLHNRLGVWALPFHFAMALTGSLLGLSTLIIGVLAMLLYRGDTSKVYGIFDDPPPAANMRPAALPRLGPMLAEAQRRAPDATAHQLTIERAGRADARITITSERETLLVPQDSFVFDAAGRLVRQRHPRDLSLGTKLVGGIGQLHFGWFGGLPVRIVYGLLGLALCTVTSSGVTIWLARRRDKGRAAPRWERLWAATVWGQPLALALAVLTALVVPAVAGAIVWLWLGLAAVLLAVAAARSMDGAILASRLRAALGAALIALAAAGLIGRTTDEVAAVVVDAVLLTAGAWLLRTACGLRRRVPHMPSR